MPKKVNLIGHKFGRLTVLADAGHIFRTNRKRVAWLCQCECGKQLKVDGSALRVGNTTSCGCSRVIDETGKKYGRLTVIRWIQDFDGQGACWLCTCDCGKEIITRGSSLRDGGSTSCGCLATEKLRAAVMLPEGVAAMNQIIRRTKSSAIDRGYDYNLSDEQLIGLMRQPCYYCGAEPTNCSRHPEQNGEFIYNGIDRVDNNTGYIIDNVVPCCKHCNIAKRDRSVSEFIEWAERLYKFSVVKGRIT